MDPPSVDVVVPTLNCESKLARCLDTVLAQQYGGRVTICVVDGGSSDGTVEVARSRGAKVVVRPGMYGGGVTGARNLGERITDSELVWVLDADNYVIEPTALTDLVHPLIDSPKINLSIPEVVTGPHQPWIAQWLNLRERRELERLRGRAIFRGSYYEVPETDFGISNATLMRRSAIQQVGGYDADVRVLMRLRAKSLARGALVPTAHYIHDTVASTLDYRKKWVKRILQYARLTDQELRGYFVSYPIEPPQHEVLARSLLREALDGPLQDLIAFWRSGDPAWLYGALFPLVGASIALPHPFAFRSVVGRYL